MTESTITIDGEPTDKPQRHLVCVLHNEAEYDLEGRETVTGDGCFLCGGALESGVPVDGTAFQCVDCGAMFKYREPVWSRVARWIRSHL